MTDPSATTAPTLIGRAWNPAAAGPSPIVVRDGDAYDVSAHFATVRDIGEASDRLARIASCKGQLLGRVSELVANARHSTRDSSRPWLLSPLDLQPVKAAGVTFAASLLERVVEERAHGDRLGASEVREEILQELGTDLASIRPGSDEALRLRESFLERGWWSQYLEVGLGPDAEIFTKSLPLASVGSGSEIGVRSATNWSNSEPEVVVLVTSSGEIYGATLGNDMNLRDVEGRSALLLGQAKDNNASCAIGPLIRLFEDDFTLDTVSSLTVTLDVSAPDGFRLTAASEMSLASRTAAELVAQTIGDHHQYPDGFALMLGTMFAPVEDRHEPGQGFTHNVGDVVTISSPELGELVNIVNASASCEPWTFGLRDLMHNLHQRGRIQ